MYRKRLMLMIAVVVVTIAIAASAGISLAQNGQGAGFLTSEPAMLEAAQPDVSIKPLLTVGDTLPGGYTFPSIPDGIAVDPRGTNQAQIYVNHETTTIPFFGTADFNNAQLSRLTLQRGNGKVAGGEIVIPSDANYVRFCSNFYAGAAEGFDRPLVFTGEESSNPVNRTGEAWPPAAGSNTEQAGVAVAFDPASGEYRTIYGMGRHNHENSVAIPGFDQAVVVSGDDTFSPPSSQLYMYIAEDADAVWNDEGSLYAFKGDEPANDYGDLELGDEVSGEFIPVPREIATGDQTALQEWSEANGVFQFIRLEDIAYDRNTPNVFYVADTGDDDTIRDPATGRLTGDGDGSGPFPNGRIFRVELDPSDPTQVLSLSILIDGDKLGAAGGGDLSLIHNPDNLETTPWSLMIQEDPGGPNNYAPDDPNGTTARIWRYDLQSGELSVVARVDQSADPNADLGDWESSGIVDASPYFGRGAFLVDVQAHTLILESETVNVEGFGAVTHKREGGQLLLLKVPGA